MWLHILAVILAPLMAFVAGRSVIFWSLCAIFFGIFALIPIILLPLKGPKPIPAFIYRGVIRSDFRKWSKSIDGVDR